MVRVPAPTRTQILSTAHHVLRRRGSTRIIQGATAKGNVRALLAEYRGYLDEAEKQLERDGIRLTPMAINLLRSEWRDQIIEYRIEYRRQAS